MPHRLHIRPARNYAPPPSRSRLLYGGLALAVIAAGLLWRSGLIPLPHWLSNNGGDALWALMVFVGFGFLMPRASTLMAALLALAFAWGVEFSQLYHAPWIDAIRATIPGRLVLGNTFNWPDLPAYAMGIVLCAWVEWRLRRRAGAIALTTEGRPRLPAGSYPIRPGSTCCGCPGLLPCRE